MTAIATKIDFAGAVSGVTYGLRQSTPGGLFIPVEIDVDVTSISNGGASVACESDGDIAYTVAANRAHLFNRRIAITTVTGQASDDANAPFIIYGSNGSTVKAKIDPTGKGTLDRLDVVGAGTHSGVGTWQLTGVWAEPTTFKGFYFGYDTVEQYGLILAGSNGPPSGIDFWTYGSPWRAVLRLTPGGDLASLMLSKGWIQRSPNGHFWRLNISDTGDVSATDLGADVPT